MIRRRDVTLMLSLCAACWLLAQLAVASPPPRTELRPREQTEVPGTPIELPHLGYALNCPGKSLISSVRYSWNKRGIKIEANQGSLYHAQEALNGIIQKTLPEQSKWPDDSVKFVQNLAWRSDFSVDRRNAGLPDQIDGCETVVVWIDYQSPSGGRLRLGDAEVLNHLSPMDLLLLGLSFEQRKAGSLLEQLISQPGNKIPVWQNALRELGNSTKIRVNDGVASGCKIENQFLQCSELAADTLKQPLFVYVRYRSNDVSMGEWITHLKGNLMFYGTGVLARISIPGLLLNNVYRLDVNHPYLLDQIYVAKQSGLSKQPRSYLRDYDYRLLKNEIHLEVRKDLLFDETGAFKSFRDSTTVPGYSTGFRKAEYGETKLIPLKEYGGAFAKLGNVLEEDWQTGEIYGGWLESPVSIRMQGKSETLCPGPLRINRSGKIQLAVFDADKSSPDNWRQKCNSAKEIRSYRDEYLEGVFKLAGNNGHYQEWIHLPDFREREWGSNIARVETIELASSWPNLANPPSRNEKCYEHKVKTVGKERIHFTTFNPNCRLSAIMIITYK